MDSNEKTEIYWQEETKTNALRSSTSQGVGNLELIGNGVYEMMKLLLFLVWAICCLT